MFCSKCGHKLEDDALFCSNCGAKVKTTSEVEIDEDILNPHENNEQSKRKVVHDGELHKCPARGEPLPASTIKCPVCGYEIRNREASLSTKQFFEKIQFTDDVKKKIEIINTFPIPNNKEDIFEFMIMSTAIYDSKYYRGGADIDDVAFAWASKIEQCYLKGKMLFSDKADNERLNELYGVKRSKPLTKPVLLRNGIIILVICAAALVAGLVLGIIATENDYSDSVFSAIGMFISFGSLGIVGGIIMIVFGKKAKKRYFEEKEIENANSRIETAKKLAAEQERKRTENLRTKEKLEAQEKRNAQKIQERQKIREAQIAAKQEERIRISEAKINAKYKK